MTANLPAVIGPTKTALAVLSSQERDVASRYALASKADSSKRAYASDWQQFTAWCAARGLEAMPASSETVSRYLGDMAETGLKVSTIRRRAASITYFHRLKSLPVPTSDELVRAVLAGIAREHAAAADRKSPVTVDVIKKMLRF